MRKQFFGSGGRVPVLAVCLCLFLLFCSLPAAAAGELQIGIDSAAAAAGEAFSVSVRLSENPGIASLKVGVEYDENALELVSSEVDGRLADIEGANVIATTGTDPVILNWVVITGVYAEDGVFGTLTFRVRDGAASGTYPLTLVIDPEDVFDEELADVSFSYADGAVTVEGRPASESTPDPVPTPTAAPTPTPVPTADSAAESTPSPTPAPTADSGGDQRQETPEAPSPVNGMVGAAANAEPRRPTPAADPAVTSEDSVAKGERTEPAPAAGEAPEEVQKTARWPLIVGILAAAAVISAVVCLVISKKQKKRGTK